MASDENNGESPPLPRESRTYAVVSMKPPTQPPMFLEEPAVVQRVVLRQSTRASTADEPSLGNLAPPRMLTRPPVRDRSKLWLLIAALVVAAGALALLLAW